MIYRIFSKTYHGLPNVHKAFDANGFTPYMVLVNVTRVNVLTVVIRTVHYREEKLFIKQFSGKDLR